MKSVRKIHIELLKTKFLHITDAVQYDTGLQLILEIKDMALPSETAAKVFFQKPSGKFVYQDAEVSGNTIVVNVHNQALTEYGRVFYQVRLTSAVDLISTFIEAIEVQKSLADSAATESITVAPAFDNAVQAAILDIENAKIAAIEYIGNGIDDSLSAAGKAADAKKVGEKLGELNRDIAEFLYDDKYPIAVNWSSGYLQSDGTIKNGGTYITSDLIIIPSGYTLVFDSYASASTYHFCEYDASGNFNSVGLGNVGLGRRKGIKIDAIGARYVRICTNSDHIDEGDVNAHFVKIPSRAIGISECSNVLPSDGLTYADGYISTSTNAVVPSDVYRYSSIVYLQKGQTIEFKCAGSSGAWLISEWTRTYKFIQGIVPGDSHYHRLQYTADHDMWVRMCSRIAVWGNYVPVEEFQDIKLYYKALYYAAEKLAPKKIVVIGDSLIHGNNLGHDATWCRLLETKSGATVYNYGINGNALASVSGATGIPMSERYRDIAEILDADIIIVEGGANDKNNNCPIGTHEDIENTTFMGACSGLIDGLREMNSTAQILFMTTYHRYANKNVLGFWEKDYADAMKAVCSYKGIPCFDNCRDSGISFHDANLKKWCDEGIYLGNLSNQHFSPKGYEFIYPKYKHWIEAQCE